METGSISVPELSGGFDLQATVESGQSYHWRREDGRMYDGTGTYGDSAWYYSVVSAPDASGYEVVRARQRNGTLEWESTTDAEPLLRRQLRLDDDLEAIVATTSDDPLLDDAYDAYRGMRLVRDPFFPCLVSFICSAQMRVSRIHDMQTTLAREFGDPVEFDGQTYHAFPTPEQLAESTEAQLRDLGLGYRAPYVQRSAALLANGEASPTDVRGLDYEAAREAMQAFVGVGDKVADCVLLFSLDYLEAVPIDTWIQTAVRDHYPHCDRGSYTETSRALRTEFGEYAGYAQTYVFHYLRTQE